MQYSNAGVRRQDRLLSEEMALELLKSGEYGVLSMVDLEGKAYGLPFSFAWDSKHSIYLHCALEGKKIECLKRNHNVSFCVVGATKVIQDKFTTEYQSIVLECVASIGLDAEERMHALMHLVEKYSPDFKQKGENYAKGSFERTEIIKLEIISWSGKGKKVGG